MVETRAATKGAPLKKPGAYNTDNYYAEKDQGFGDVGVDQEPDAGAADNPQDKDFTMSREEEQAATAAAQEEVPDEGNVREEMEDLKEMGKEGEPALDERGEPVPIEGGEDLEEQEVPENTATTM